MQVQRKRQELPAFPMILPLRRSASLQPGVKIGNIQTIP